MAPEDGIAVINIYASNNKGFKICQAEVDGAKAGKQTTIVVVDLILFFQQQTEQLENQRGYTA